MNFKNIVNKIKADLVYIRLKQKVNLTTNKEKNIELLETIKLKFNNEIDKIIDDYNIIILTKNITEKKLSNLIKNKKAYGYLLIDYIKSLINDSKNTYTVVMFLKSNKITSFDITENSNINGFIYNKGYYNIDSSAVTLQNNKSIIFYKYGYSAPINFKTSKFIRDESGINEDGYEIELSCTNLKEVIDGQAFKGIINLGKPSAGFFENVDMTLVLAAMVIIGLFILHFTGTIDLAKMFALG